MSGVHTFGTQRSHLWDTAFTPLGHSVHTFGTQRSHLWDAAFTPLGHSVHTFGTQRSHLWDTAFTPLGHSIHTFGMQRSRTRVNRSRSTHLIEPVFATLVPASQHLAVVGGVPPRDVLHLVAGEGQHVRQRFPPAHLVQQRPVAGVLTRVAVQPAGLGARVHLRPHVVRPVQHVPAISNSKQQ